MVRTIKDLSVLWFTLTPPILFLNLFLGQDIDIDKREAENPRYKVNPDLISNLYRVTHHSSLFVHGKNGLSQTSVVLS